MFEQVVEWLHGDESRRRASPPRSGRQRPTAPRGDERRGAGDERRARPACSMYIAHEAGRFEVARRAAGPLFKGCDEDRDYSEMLMECAATVEDAVEAAVCDEQRTSAASRRADLLAASAPAKIRRLAELAGRVVRSQPEALVSLLELEPQSTVLQEAFDAADGIAEACSAWLSFLPLKRGFAVSRFHNSHSLALKYAEKLEARFVCADAAVRKLDLLQQRLPAVQRRVRFDNRVGERLVKRADFSSHCCLFGLDDPPGGVVVLEDRFAAGNVEDFLTDAAPLGLGVDSTHLFCFRTSRNEVFLTSSPTVADAFSLAAAAAPDADQIVEPKVLATTTLYQTVDKPRKLALCESDEIWRATIDGRAYFFCVDDVDRGLRHLLHEAGASDEALKEMGVDFHQLQ
ncbi:hypothetical protein M885DRAFT_519471 [Pelagophyceae sp. CCMP2097]|nr:hypothetical protein M885DRAFT_519471 [Pelagophyceae sp. CCMP2097]